MSDSRVAPYEGFFLFPQAAAGNLQQAVDHLKEILARADAEIVSMSKWDERRLAYEIRGNKRGIYFLVYFNAAADRLVGIERDCNLSEHVLRAMMTRADHLTEEEMKAADGLTELETEIKLRSQEGESSSDAEVVAAAAGTEPAADQ
jgi:small subunit ribosomal protein S6